MKRWEYKIEYTQLSEIQLNKLGAEGWEHYLIQGAYNYFKRPVFDKQPTTFLRESVEEQEVVVHRYEH